MPDYEYGAGFLGLRCSLVSLDAIDSPTWIGRRLCHFNTQTTVKLSFDAQAEGEEAGMTLFMRAGFHYDVGVTRRDGRRLLVARSKVGTLTSEKAIEVAEPGELEISIVCEKEWFDLGYIGNGGNRISLMRTEARFISTEMAGGFTGLFLALYAQGSRDSGGGSWTRFRDFVYRT